MPRIERRPLDNLNAEWAVLADRASADALASLGAREQAIALLGCTDLGHLVRVMGRGPGNVGRNEAAQLFRYMLRSADAHPLVPRPSSRRWRPASSRWPGGSAGLGAATGTTAALLR